MPRNLPVDPAITKAREAFAESGLNYRQLGEAMGWTGEHGRKQAYQLLNYTSDPRVSTLRRFAVAVRINIRELL